MTAIDFLIHLFSWIISVVISVVTGAAVSGVFLLISFFLGVDEAIALISVAVVGFYCFTVMIRIFQPRFKKYLSVTFTAKKKPSE